MESNFYYVLSELWQKKIDQEFKSVVYGRYNCLDHFAVNIILPKNKTVSVCGNHNYIKSYTDAEMYKIASGLDPKVRDLPVVPWRLMLSPNDGERMNMYSSFKEVLHGLHSGMSFMKRVGDITLNVAVASKEKSKENASVFLDNAEDIMSLGAYIYDKFRSDLNSTLFERFPVVPEIVVSDREFKVLDDFKRQWKDRSMFLAYDV